MQARKVIAAVTLVAGATTVVALTVPAIADTDGAAGQRAGSAVPAAGTAARAPSAAQVSPQLVAAMQRDLELSRDEVRHRLDVEASTPDIESRVRTETGRAFGGAWFSPERARLMVAVTDPAVADRVRALGAEPWLVARSSAQLEAARRQLDRNAAAASSQVSGWFVDPRTNSVTVLAREGGQQKARAFARTAGLPAAAVRVQTVPADFRAFFDVRGGDRFIINRSGRCSVGFPVTTGFVTAGHCGRAGATTTGFNNAAQGTFRVSKFGNGAGNDYAVVDVNRNWTPRPVVATADGDVPVAGSREAPVGASVCRTGSTTGTRCGAITARDASLRVSGRTVTGFIITSACAQPGDSGGALLAGNQAQGVLSGGAGSCSGGRARTVYQPINPVLATEGLTLMTTNGPQPAPRPTPSQPRPTPSQPGEPTPAPGDPAVQRAEAEVVRLVNQERVEAGCAVLNVDARLTRAARAHSRDMAANGFFSHTNRQGKGPSQRVSDAGYRWRMTGENIASGQPTAAAVMSAWMNSPGHRRNILNCGYRDIGVGLAFRDTSGRRVPFWTQNFGTPR